MGTHLAKADPPAQAPNTQLRSNQEGFRWMGKQAGISDALLALGVD
ncbi:MAG: hypothetical protein KDI42_04370 [Gammaproteobacteria bacterium]|nr:hypothetical protein [Gammaproteobacteria bacterium]